MPVERGEVSQGLLLGDGLLQTALAEAAQAQSHRLAHHGGRLALAHRQQAGGGRHPVLQGGQPSGQEECEDPVPAG